MPEFSGFPVSGPLGWCPSPAKKTYPYQLIHSAHCLDTFWSVSVDIESRLLSKETRAHRVHRRKVRRIAEYIRHQLDEDKLGEQMTMFGKDDDPFKGGK